MFPPSSELRSLASMAKWCGGLIDEELDCYRSNWSEEVCFKGKVMWTLLSRWVVMLITQSAFLVRFYFGRKREEDDQRRSESPSIKAILWSFGLSCGQTEKEIGGQGLIWGKGNEVGLMSMMVKRMGWFVAVPKSSIRAPRPQLKLASTLGGLETHSTRVGEEYHGMRRELEVSVRPSDLLAEDGDLGFDQLIVSYSNNESFLSTLMLNKATEEGVKGLILEDADAQGDSNSNTLSKVLFE
ncbi:unnamed protein product [Citrullus colocynthis]|uniref:Uncharacterized protein n=1 Tax=Citrullus colocynthis TaxID=252529 RepID=A0ABP0XT20_9ROSI